MRNWPLLFIIVPLVELYVIIAVGERIGAFWTVILVLLTAFIGVNLLRIQGVSTLMRAQQNMARGVVPAMEMMEGMALAVGGVLLITPGFITDSIGFLLLVPASRRMIIHYMMLKSTMKTRFDGQPSQWQSHQPPQNPTAGASDTKDRKQGRTIEGEYRRED